MKDSYTAAGVLWSGYIMLVKHGAPIDVQTRMLRAAEEEETRENGQQVSTGNGSWEGEPHFNGNGETPTHP